MVLHNPNNWHWVNKDASSWAKTYLETSIKGIKAERKGKVITIFDLKLVIEYSGMLPNFYLITRYADQHRSN